MIPLVVKFEDMSRFHVVLSGLIPILHIVLIKYHFSLVGCPTPSRERSRTVVITRMDPFKYNADHIL